MQCRTLTWSNAVVVYLSIYRTGAKCALDARHIATVFNTFIVYNKYLASYPRSAKKKQHKVAGSIRNKFIQFFNFSNPSSRTMALESTQPLTEISTKNLTGGKGRSAGA
jgi:hypothetical protein